MPDFGPDPIQIHDVAKPKTHTTKRVSMPPPRLLPPMGPITNMTPSRVLSSTAEGNEGNDVDRIKTIRRKYRKVLNPTPIEGIDVGGSEEAIKAILNYHHHYKMLWIQVKLHKNSYQNKEK